MAPAADQDKRLLFLQGEVARLRAQHEDLVSRERTLRNMKLIASADDMKRRVDAAFNEWHEASVKLASYISKKMRGVKT